MLIPPSQPGRDPWQEDTWHMPLPSQQAALDALIWSWGECYEIGCDNTGEWWYQRRDGRGGRETARNPDDLRIQIAADYTFLPVRPSQPSARRPARQQSRGPGPAPHRR